MKYMLYCSISPENYDASLDAFLEGGAPMPDGLTSLGRWHAPGSTKGWLLCETNDPVELSHHVGQWAGLLNIEVTPVAGDAVSGESAARIRAS